MPWDQVVIHDMPDLYYVAVRALRYSEPSSESSSEKSTGALRDTGYTTISLEKRFDKRGGISDWMHSLIGHFGIH